MRQVLKPVCEEARKRAASRGGPQGEGAGGEEDTFVSLLTSRRTLDLKFSTVPTRFVRVCVWCVCGRTPLLYLLVLYGTVYGMVWYGMVIYVCVSLSLLALCIQSSSICFGTFDFRLKNRLAQGPRPKD